MKEFHSNINIVWRPCGFSSCTFFSHTWLQNFNFGKNPIFNKHQYPDKRTTAISEGSKNFLKNIDVWRD